MDFKHDAVRLIDIMRTTYIKKDLRLGLSLFKGKDDPQPKSTSLRFSVKMNLMEATAWGAGVILAAAAIYECCQKASEVKALKRILKERDERRDGWVEEI